MAKAKTALSFNSPHACDCEVFAAYRVIGGRPGLAKVFLSYAREDAPAAKQLAECIGRAGAGLQDQARPVARLILAAA